MKPRTKWILIALLLLLAPLWVFGDPPAYFAKEINGQVVDAATGQPLEGVVIVAVWKFYSQGIGSGGHGGALNTLETITDKDGRYHLPGWGPRPRPPFAYLDYLDPEITVFKSDYYPESLANEVVGSGNRNRSVVRTSEWDGKVIKLRPFAGDWVDYSFKLRTLWDPIGHCVRTCPRLVLALDAEDKRIKQVAPKKPVIPTIVDIDNLREDDRAFLRDFHHGPSKK